MSRTRRGPTAAPWAFGKSQLLAMFLTMVIGSAARGDTPGLQSVIVQLGSDNPQLRQEAMGRLMGLKKQDLPAVRAAALAQSPLLPGQIAALHEAVIQIFLAAEGYRVDADCPGGFLGLRWSIVQPPQSSEGVVVEERIPGFSAYRLLQSGDVIVQFLDWPMAPIAQQFRS